MSILENSINFTAMARRDMPDIAKFMSGPGHAEFRPAVGDLMSFAGAEGVVFVLIEKRFILGQDASLRVDYLFDVRRQGQRRILDCMDQL